MSRNGTGTYSVPNTFVAGTAITASDHNENWTDIGSEITNSVAVDGQSTMTGPLKASSGTAAAPSITFGADTNTGAYRSGADEYSVAAGGTQIHKTSSAGLDVVLGKLKEGGYSLIPPGFIGPYGGSSAPGGWLLCDGTAVSRTTYADLFGVIGSTYGSGDGSTTFNTPDLKGRVPAGKEATATRLTTAVSGVDGATLGAAGGSQSHTLILSETPAHDHGGVTGNTQVQVNYTTIDKPNGGSAVPLAIDPAGANSGLTPAHNHSIASQGSGTAHNNVQPTLVVNYIIKT